jgi:hypothetical protein
LTIKPIFRCNLKKLGAKLGVNFLGRIKLPEYVASTDLLDKNIVIAENYKEIKNNETLI